MIDQFVAAVSRNPRKKHFYHFTDKANLPSIREHGILSMKSLRKSAIPIAAPGGNQWSWDADQHCEMDAYVHLCFFKEHPMEWIAKQEGRIADSIFLRIDPSIIQSPGVLVSDAVANKSGVTPLPAADILEKLDLEVIYNRTDWKDASVQERLKAARLYEILIPTVVPIEMIVDFR